MYKIIEAQKSINIQSPLLQTEAKIICNEIDSVVIKQNGEAIETNNILTTKGDILIHDVSDSTRFPRGTNGQILSTDDTVDAGLKWIDQSGATNIFTDIEIGDTSENAQTLIKLLRVALKNHYIRYVPELYELDKINRFEYYTNQDYGALGINAMIPFFYLLATANNYGTIAKIFSSDNKLYGVNSRGFVNDYFYLSADYDIDKFKYVQNSVNYNTFYELHQHKTNNALSFINVLNKISSNKDIDTSANMTCNILNYTTLNPPVSGSIPANVECETLKCEKTESSTTPFITIKNNSTGVSRKSRIKFEDSNAVGTYYLGLNIDGANTQLRIDNYDFSKYFYFHDYGFWSNFEAHYILNSSIDTAAFSIYNENNNAANNYRRIDLNSAEHTSNAFIKVVGYDFKIGGDMTGYELNYNFQNNLFTTQRNLMEDSFSTDTNLLTLSNRNNVGATTWCGILFQTPVAGGSPSRIYLKQSYLHLSQYVGSNEHNQIKITTGQNGIYFPKTDGSLTSSQLGITSGGQVCLYSSSSIRNKNICEDQIIDSSIIYDMHPKKYHYKSDIQDDERIQLGLMAEDVNDIDPKYVIHRDEEVFNEDTQTYDIVNRVFDLKHNCIYMLMLIELQKTHSDLEDAKQTIVAQQLQITNLQDQITTLTDEINAIKTFLNL